MYTIRRVEGVSTKELEPIYRLRYDSYVRELRKNLAWANNSDGLLADAFEADAIHLRLDWNATTVGCVRIHVDPIPFALTRFLLLDRLHPLPAGTFCRVSKLFLRADHRRTTAAGRLLAAAHALLLERSVRLVFCNAFPHLAPLYERLGFERYYGPYKDPDFGEHYSLVGQLDSQAQRQRGRAYRYVAKAAGHRALECRCRPKN